MHSRRTVKPACRMKEATTMQPQSWIGRTTVLGLLMMFALPVSAQTSVPSADAWAWRFAVNGWFPSIRSSTQLGLAAGGSISTDTDPGSYLSKLEFVFMGTLEARRGPWSFLVDATYLSLGDLKSQVRSITGPSGIVTVPIDTGSHSDLKGFIGTFEAGY